MVEAVSLCWSSREEQSASTDYAVIDVCRSQWERTPWMETWCQHPKHFCGSSPLHVVWCSFGLFQNTSSGPACTTWPGLEPMGHPDLGPTTRSVWRAALWKWSTLVTIGLSVSQGWGGPQRWCCSVELESWTAPWEAWTDNTTETESPR